MKRDIDSQQNILQRPIMFYDGVCNLCCRSVQFVIKHDKHKLFLFASLQSPTGRQVVGKLNGSVYPHLDSLVVLRDGKYYIKSDAVMQIILVIGGVWNIFLILKLVPRPWRNKIYDWVARNRYRWFGRTETCLMPTPELQERFLPD